MLKTWWESLNEREHKLVMGAGSVFTVGLFFLAVWQPLANAVVDNRASLTKQQQLNSWATDSIAQIKGASGKANAGGGGSLTQIVNQSSRQFKIKIARMNPKGEELQLWIDDVVFNDLLKWLGHLEQKQGVSILNVDVNEGSDPGVVNVRRLIITK
ncbi:MAG: general secretion pathway protein M [Phenylobacterium sp.]|jgi:general secretion pathway protein M